jgi:hypothetical protein
MCHGTALELISTNESDPQDKAVKGDNNLKARRTIAMIHKCPPGFPNR